MSGAHDPHGHHPENELAEPKTPMWLPALGAAILLAGVCFWVLGPQSAAEGADKAADKPAATATAPAAKAPPAPPRGKPSGHP
jgi:hypothetical protein